MGFAAFKQVIANALVLCAMFAHAPWANGQTPDGDPDNAATWYRAAYAEYKSVQFEMDLYDHQEAFETNPDRGPSPEARKFLRRYREAVSLTKRAATREFCDFGPYDPRDDNPLHDASNMRALAWALRDDYLLRVFDGDIKEAIDDLCVEFRIARHIATQRGGLPVLVGASIISFADRLVQHAIDRALIGPGEATRLVRELEKFKGEDPLGFREAMLAQQNAFRQGLDTRYSGVDGLQRFRDEYLPYYRQEEDQESIAALERMTPEDLERLMATCRLLLDRVTAAIGNADAEKALGELQVIDKELKDGVHGRFALNVVGYSAWALSDARSPRKTLDDRIAALKGIADGSIDPLSLANAACWYVRASVRIEQIDPTALQLIDAYAVNHDFAAAIGEQLSDELKRDDVLDVLHMLATAAGIERCDFSYTNDYLTLTHRAHHAGLLACGRLLAADATRLLHNGQREAAAARIVQAYRLSSALAGDGCIAGSLAAHRIFNDADALAVPLIDGGGLQESQITALKNSLSRFSRGDPFHYQPTIAAMRESVGGWFVWLVQGAPSIRVRPNGRPPAPDQRHLDEAQTIVDQLDIDRLMALAVATEGRYMVNGETRMPTRAPIEGLWPIFDVEAMQRSRELMPVLLQWAKMNVISGVPQANLPIIAPIEARSKQSIEDFRACVRRMKLDDPAPTPAATTSPQ